MLQSIIILCLAAQCLAQSNQYLPPDEGYSYKPPQVPFPSNPGIVSQPPPSPPVGPPSPSLPPPGPNTPYPPASRPPSGPGAPIAGNAPVSGTSILRQAWNELLTAVFLLLQWWGEEWMVKYCKWTKSWYYQLPIQFYNMYDRFCTQNSKNPNQLQTQISQYCLDHWQRPPPPPHYPIS